MSVVEVSRCTSTHREEWPPTVVVCVSAVVSRRRQLRYHRQICVGRDEEYEPQVYDRVSRHADRETGLSAWIISATDKLCQIGIAPTSVAGHTLDTKPLWTTQPDPQERRMHLNTRMNTRACTHTRDPVPQDSLTRGRESASNQGRASVACSTTCA